MLRTRPLHAEPRARRAPRLVAILGVVVLQIATIGPLASSAMALTVPAPQPGQTVAEVRAQYTILLEEQQKLFDRQLAELEADLAAAEKRVSALEKEKASDDAQIIAYEQRIADLRAQITGMKSGASSTGDEVVALQSENESLKAENATLLETQVERAEELAALKAENKELAEKAGAVRPPIGQDPLDWALLVGGVVLGAIVGVIVGTRRGAAQATVALGPDGLSAWSGESGESEHAGEDSSDTPHSAQPETPQASAEWPVCTW